MGDGANQMRGNGEGTAMAGFRAARRECTLSLQIDRRTTAWMRDDRGATIKHD